ncbi:MAG: DUF72 domain-containing protein, partial [Actinomycetota bacterium]
MSQMLVGCAGFAVDPTEYSTQLGFVEIQESFHEGATLDKVRRTIERVAGDLALGLVASKVITHPRKDPVYKVPGPDVPDHAAVGHFTRSRWTDEAWERTDAMVRALKAKVVLLRTPPSFKKTAANALALEHFVAHAARPGLEIAWEYSSGWPESDALATCERLGLIPVVDLNAKSFPPGDLYARFTGGGTGR